MIEQTIAILASGLFLLSNYANVTVVAQQRSHTLEGTVVEVTGGARWLGIVILANGRRYVVETADGNDPKRDPKIIGGQVEVVGTHVRVFYTSMSPSGIVAEPVLNVTKIIKLSGSNSLSPIGTKLPQPNSDWNSFFAALRTAVNKRDRASLKNLMTKDFAYDCCDSFDGNHDGDTRDDAFRNWDDRRVRGWAALERVLVAGAVPVSGWLINPSNSLPRRVSPPQAVRGSSYSNWIAEFELRNGRWFFVSFQMPESD